jgi:hypothetical protein
MEFFPADLDVLSFLPFCEFSVVEVVGVGDWLFSVVLTALVGPLGCVVDRVVGGCVVDRVVGGCVVDCVVDCRVVDCRVVDCRVVDRVVDGRVVDGRVVDGRVVDCVVCRVVDRVECRGLLGRLARRRRPCRRPCRRPTPVARVLSRALLTKFLPNPKISKSINLLSLSFLIATRGITI